MWWMLTTLTDQVLGEGPHMKYIDLSIDAATFLENDYIGFRCEPGENPEADWRMDVMAGSSTGVRGFLNLSGIYAML